MPRWKPILRKKLKGEPMTPQEVLALGDWGLGQVVELGTEHRLPIKIHTGYLARADYMMIDQVRPELLTELLIKYPRARFDFFHIAYPYQMQLAAMAKHFANLSIDMCWGWALDPYSARDLVRRVIQSVPSNKLFVFGGDTGTPTPVVGYAATARAWLTSALQAEVDEGLMNEKEAMELATRLMRENQREYFDIAAKQKANRKAAGLAS